MNESDCRFGLSKWFDSEAVTQSVRDHSSAYKNVVPIRQTDNSVVSARSSAVDASEFSAFLGRSLFPFGVSLARSKALDGFYLVRSHYVPSIKNPLGATTWHRA